jgi:phage shock protein C
VYRGERYNRGMSDYNIPEPPRRLYRSRRDRKIFGVCGGIAEYFGIDSTLVRLVLVLLVLVGGGGVLAYFIAALVLHDNPEQ